MSCEDETSAFVLPLSHRCHAPQYLSLHQLLEAHAKRIPNAVAILAPGRAPLTYDRLHRHVDDMVQRLYALGLACEDRIALALPNGPEMATAFLAVAAGATCAPLNPAHSATEIDFSLTDLDVKALVVHVGMASPARAVAHARGIPIIELSPVPEAEAGLFTLTGEGHRHTIRQRFSQPDDIAIVLHTSGTTSRPKIVPLTHADICTVAHHMRVSLDLVESDRCLNVQPLFHSHGLINALLGSLMAGQVLCVLQASMRLDSLPGWHNFAQHGIPPSPAYIRRSWRVLLCTARALRTRRCGSSVRALLRCPDTCSPSSKGCSTCP